MEMAQVEETTLAKINMKETRASIANKHALNTPPVGTPPRIRTPPPKAVGFANERSAGSSRTAHERSTSQVDPNMLSKALMKEFEEGRTREVTPGGSPSRKRQRVYGDR
jgi:cell division cycle 20-like protein 1 (cofactor of APC complex)